MPSSANERLFIGSLAHHTEDVTIKGWVAKKRDHGKVAFLDIQDGTGKIQAVALADQPFFEHVQKVKEESSVVVEGMVVMRPESMRTSGPNGDRELQIKSLTVCAEAKDFPWNTQDTSQISEELRLRYRYLDLRSDRMHYNLKLRSHVNHFIRNYLFERSFTEVETPYITKGTPEGAREYIVPSRKHPGLFYSLPQSPQQFKQLLMVGGIDRYFQIARCFRDEDSRVDRQPEFTQLDVEMSFVNREIILQLVEEMYIALVRAVTPEKRITTIPFPRLTYAEALERYQTDKPDLRTNPDDLNELAFCWVIDQPLFEYSESENKLVAVHHLFTRPLAGQEHLLDTSPETVTADSYDLALNGYEIIGGSMRVHERELQAKVFKILGISDAEAQARFGHMLEAFAYGPPPHGGFASGLDRLVTVLAGESSIREVIAFPKTGDGRDLMMGAPAPIDPSQLKENHIEFDEPTRQ